MGISGQYPTTHSLIWVGGFKVIPHMVYFFKEKNLDSTLSVYILEAQYLLTKGSLFVLSSFVHLNFSTIKTV